MDSKAIDVDATWDGKGSLDDHRQAEFAKLKQSGFGAASLKAAAKKAAAAEYVIETPSNANN